MRYKNIIFDFGNVIGKFKETISWENLLLHRKIIIFLLMPFLKTG